MGVIVVSDVFLEIVVIAAEALSAGIESRDEIETPLEHALSVSGVGEVTGGGGGSGVYVVEVEVPSEELLASALAVIRSVLQALEVPQSTLIKGHRPHAQVYLVFA